MGSDLVKVPLTSQLHENKLKPSAISIPTLPNNANEAKLLRKKKPTDEDDEAWNTDEELRNDAKPKGKNDFKSKNKRLTKTNDQRHNGSTEPVSNVFVANSVRCLKDPQVALMQTRPFNSSAVSGEAN